MKIVRAASNDIQRIVRSFQLHRTGARGTSGAEAHAPTHLPGGNDVIPAALPGGQSGLLTGADKTQLDKTTGTNTGDQDLSGKEDVGVAAGLDDQHLLDFTHSDIAHVNRAALDLVSGTNTGDQDLSNVLRSNVASTMTAGQSHTPSVLSGASVTPDFDARDFFTYVMAVNGTINNPSNNKAGTKIIKVTGNFTLTLGTAYKVMTGTYDGSATANIMTLVSDGTDVYTYIDTQP